MISGKSGNYHMESMIHTRYLGILVRLIIWDFFNMFKIFLGHVVFGKQSREPDFSINENLDPSLYQKKIFVMHTECKISYLFGAVVDC